MYARVVTIKDWSVVQKEQADVGVLFTMSTLRVALRKAWALSPVVDLDSRPSLDPGRVMASLPSAETQLAPRLRLTVATMELMRTVITANSDKQLASQSRAWLGTFENDEYLPPVDVHPFLSPATGRFSELARTVRGRVGPRLPGDAVWERSVSARETDGRHSTSMRRLDARAVMHAARPDWLLCQFLDAVLAELSFYSDENNCGAYIMPCDNFNMMMSTPSGDTARIVDARKFASKWAREAGESRSILTLVNLSRSHWCAAHLCLDTRVVTFANSGSDSYDDIPLAIRRLVMLGECVVSSRRKPEAEEAVDETPWSVKNICPVMQRDGYNCGVFALRFLIGVVTGTELPIALGGDLLRLMMIHRVVSSTVAVPVPQRQHARSTTVVLPAAAPQPQGASKASNVNAGPPTASQPLPLEGVDGNTSALLTPMTLPIAAGQSSSTGDPVALSSAPAGAPSLPLPMRMDPRAATPHSPQGISVGPPSADAGAPTATFLELAAMLGPPAPTAVVAPTDDPVLPGVGSQSLPPVGIPGGLLADHARRLMGPAARSCSVARQEGDVSAADAEDRGTPCASKPAGGAADARAE